jgi:hypothetical protein
LFQTLDSKNQCHAIYQDGVFHFEDLDNVQLSNETWAYHPLLRGDDINIASVYAQGATLKECCPAEFIEIYDKIEKKLQSFNLAFETVNLNIDDWCIYDFVPKSFLTDFCEIKNTITENVLLNYSKPQNYDHMLNIHRLLGEMNYNEVLFDFGVAGGLATTKALRAKLKSVREGNMWIQYDPYGTVTGRLTCKPHSFPILNLPAKFRTALQPKNDLFVEIDYNAAELRTMLALAGHEQPLEDIHMWNMKNVFTRVSKRESAKKRAFQWLYGKTSPNKTLEKIYDKTKIKEDYFHGHYVKTPFERVIECDDDHAINYVIQSTTADIVLEKAFEIQNYLNNRKTNLAFIIHDCIILDVSKKDLDIIEEVGRMFSNTRFGDFRSSIKAGKNLGEMREI